jgi:superfamily II RNA helicase
MATVMTYDQKYRDLFDFDLSQWQLRALAAIERGDHCLVTAPTGSGKTLPALFSIDYFVKKLGKKVIYTSPIKALSNQKYYEFQEKYPDISFGILTGDIKDNPEADVLIMTTEILCNHLHNLRHPESKLEFNIDIQAELGCVVFDEVHYINDADRGTVWEECFMLLPPQVQLVMLSATIATPEKFAKWVEGIHKNEPTPKSVELCETDHRAVPLKHYLWLTAIDSAFKTKEQGLTSLMESVCNKPVDLFSTSDGFQERNFRNVSKVRSHLQKNHHIKRQHVLNGVIRYLKEHTMLPAICFVYSRKNVERFAKEVSQHLIDSTMINQVEKECRSILTKFPNYHEFMALPEYSMIVKLLEKGIGIHHSGMLPVFREMVELMFTRGYIQMLFATETFAVGLNMPTKTVLFTALQKFDGQGMRYLLPHEYTQQAGRAGRRGYDTIGHVLHIANLFELPTNEEYRTILGNVPQKIVSKFKISYSLLLNSENPNEFIKNSACNQDIQKQMEYLTEEKRKLESEVEVISNTLRDYSNTPYEALTKIYDIQTNMNMYRNKVRKTKERELQGLLETYHDAKKEVEWLKNLNEKKQELDDWLKRIDATENYVKYQVEAIQEILRANHFVDIEQRGILARSIKETHPLMMTDAYEKFDRCDATELAAFFSCFTNVNVEGSVKNPMPRCSYNRSTQMMEIAYQQLNHYYNEEVRTNIFSGECYDIQFDIVDEVIEWCKLENEESCKTFLAKIHKEKGIFLGEFTKAILKINAIANEMEKIAEMMGHIDIQHTLQQIGPLTLKSVCTSQSLYV